MYYIQIFFQMPLFIIRNKNKLNIIHQLYLIRFYFINNLKFVLQHCDVFHIINCRILVIIFLNTFIVTIDRQFVIVHIILLIFIFLNLIEYFFL